MESKKIWSQFAAKQFANSIATKKPKISFPKNKLIQKEWDILENNNNLLKINYQLVNNSSLDNVSFLGLKEFNGVPLLVIGKSNTYKTIGNKLVELYVMVDIYKNWSIYEQYDLNENNDMKNLIFRRAENSQYNSKSTPSAIGYHLSNVSFLKTKNIPFTPFFSNPLENNDLDNIDQEIFDDWKTSIELLLTDSLVSKGIIHINSPQMAGSDKNISNLKEALKNPKQVIFENTNIFSLLQQGGLQIQQGTSNYESIIKKIQFYENKIKQFGFLKKETSDLGTKNLQSSETELLNSDSDDYIELKANLMELQWEKFIRDVFFDYLKNIKNINTDLKNAVIEVEICGSTKYLQNTSNKYVQNQQGSLTNPNDFTNNTNENKNE